MLFHTLSPAAQLMRFVRVKYIVIAMHQLHLQSTGQTLYLLDANGDQVVLKMPYKIHHLHRFHMIPILPFAQ